MASPFGEVVNPLQTIGTSNGKPFYAGLADGGMLSFISNVIRLVTIGAGLFAFFNLIIAGFTYISAGSDAKKTEAAWAQIYMSLIGLVVIVASYTIAGIIGLVLFKDAGALLQPKIYGPGAN